MEEANQDGRARMRGEIFSIFELCETLESISFLELALWKKELSIGWNKDRTKRIGLDREQCLNPRMASVMLPNVGALLWMKVVLCDPSQTNRRWNTN